MTKWESSSQLVFSALGKHALLESDHSGTQTCVWTDPSLYPLLNPGPIDEGFRHMDNSVQASRIVHRHADLRPYITHSITATWIVFVHAIIALPLYGRVMSELTHSVGVFL